MLPKILEALKNTEEPLSLRELSRRLDVQEGVLKE